LATSPVSLTLPHVSAWRLPPGCLAAKGRVENRKTSTVRFDGKKEWGI
jgi:hypothetical protein